MVNKEMKFLDNGDIRYEVVDEAARSNIQTINTVLDTKADTSDMSNYYTKSETYNKTEVDDLIESSGSGSGGGTGDGDVKKNLLFDSILDDETKTKVNITINTAGEASENEVKNIRNDATLVWGTGTSENPAVGKIGVRNSGYLGYTANGKSLCIPVIGGHTYAFVPETSKTQDSYWTVANMCFAPDFDFTFNKAYQNIPKTSGSIAFDVSLHTIAGTGKLYNKNIKDKIIVPEGMQYIIWGSGDSLITDSEELYGIRKFKVYDYTLYPVDATYEQIVDNPVTGEDFTITYNLTNSTSTNTASTVTTGTTYATTINANQNNYISSCSVTVGGITYTPTNGSLVINEANSNITINTIGESAPNNTYEGFYTVKESLIPNSILDSKLDTPNNLLNATEGKLLYTDGEGGLTLSLPKESVDIIAHDLEYVPVYGEWIAGYYYDTNGTYTQATTETVWGQPFVERANCTPYDSMVECKQGEKWRFSVPYLYKDSDKAYLPSVLIFDKDKNLLDTIVHATAEEDGYIYKTIPENGAYLAVIHLTGGTCLMQRLGLPVYTKRQVEDLIESNWNVTKRLPAPKLNTLTKGYICVGTDDLRVQHTENLHNMFTEHNIPYYISAIPEMLKHTAGSTPYRNNLYYARQCVANGGELCVHNGGQITADNIDDYNKLYDYFIEKRRELEFYGFKVRGIITAGGTGVVKSDERINKWCSTFYDFNDSMGYTLPFLFGRRDFAFTTEADLDTYVENVCVNHGYQIFYAHNYADPEINSFNYLLEKLSNYTRGVDYEFITPSQLYDLLMPKKQDDYYTKSEVDNLINNLSLRVQQLEGQS